MRGYEHRRATDLDQVKQVPSRHRVQANCWLVKVSQLWTSQQGESCAELSPVASAQDTRVLVVLVEL